MKITRMKTNRMVNPLGFALDTPHLSYVATDTDAKVQTAARIRVAADEGMTQLLHDSGRREDLSSLWYAPPLSLTPRTRYYWQVEVWADNGDVAISPVAWFETGKLDEPWQAEWITPDLPRDVHPVLMTAFDCARPVASARIHLCGLGVYELYLNGDKVGEEYLTPNCNAYDMWLQAQTYDVTRALAAHNRLEVWLGDGWYKGRFGFDGKSREIYGDRFALIAELHVTYADGSKEVFVTRPGSWLAKRSKVLSSGMYDGEIYDETLAQKESFPVRALALDTSRLQDRLSLPVVEKLRLPVQKVLRTPAGETVLDMGQNMVGWISFRNRLPRGATVKLEFGEILQQDNFYTENLRTANQQFTYTSDGEERWVRPHHTFFGFRYVRVTGWPEELDLADFVGCVLYSDMEEQGAIETSDPRVNRLFLNALWGQRGNFLDVPTDCPQRDERMGWTGDAQVFSGTASYNMDTYAFYTKYGHDVYLEQTKGGGGVPHVVPDFLNAIVRHNAETFRQIGIEGETVDFQQDESRGSTAWGEAATVIPWNVYLHYGDPAILERQLASMKAWVDYMRAKDEATGGRRLWTVGFHFADWLALDGVEPEGVFGGTDPYFIASAYYRYSAGLVAKAARALGKTELAEEYQRLSDEVRDAMVREYYTPTGRLAVETQTGHVVALYMDIVPEAFRARTIRDLRAKLAERDDHLCTGFVGTPYLCRVLSDQGLNDLAYKLLLHNDYPSWLYEVEMGATTIWERWNSVLPDGSISGTGMNSLNHYAYGSVVEWMYRNMCGLRPDEAAPGFRHFTLAPQPNARLGYARCRVDSAKGLIESGWKLDGGRLEMTATVPFDTTATWALPGAKLDGLAINGASPQSLGLAVREQADGVVVELPAGRYTCAYAVEEDAQDA